MQRQIGPLSANRYHLNFAWVELLKVFHFSDPPPPTVVGDFQLDRLAYVNICATSQHWKLSGMFSYRFDFHSAFCIHFYSSSPSSSFAFYLFIAQLHLCSRVNIVCIVTCKSICVIVLKIAAICLCREEEVARSRGPAESSRTSCIIDLLMNMLAIIRAGHNWFRGFFRRAHDRQMYKRN